MLERFRVLLLDDDPRFLEVYEELLARLPSQPEIRTASSGAHALALLGAEPFSLLLCDLNMPHMDGLQVLAIVRRKFPQLRTAVLTAMTDPQLRRRAYGMGVDLYLEKPSSPEDIQLFLNCVESLLGHALTPDFPGMPSKGLWDIIQLECLGHESSVLQIRFGAQAGSIWFQNGELIDAAAPNLTGQAALGQMLTWKTATVEVLPAEPARPRTIFHPVQALLQETAHALEDAEKQAVGLDGAPVLGTMAAASKPVQILAQSAGVQFGLLIRGDRQPPLESWAVEDPPALAGWTQATLERFRLLGKELRMGPLDQVSGSGLDHQVVLAARDNRAFCVGFQPSLPAPRVSAIMGNLLTRPNL